MAAKVYPVNKNDFTVNIAASGEEDNFVPILNMTSLTVDLSPVIETWYPMDTHGWERHMKTGFSGSISTELKRTYGDPGNDKIFSTCFSLDPDEVFMDFKWTWPDGTIVAFNGLVSVESMAGETTAVDGGTVTIYIDGEVEVTEPTAG